MLHAARRDLLLDDPADFEVTGLVPGAPVIVRASGEAPPIAGVAESTAHFVASDDGVVRVARDPSIDGSYVGVDPFGLWWSAGWGASGIPTSDGRGFRTEPLPWRITVEDESARTIHEVEVVRRMVAANVGLEPVDSGGIEAVYARPPGDGPFPAVVLVDGSDPGFVWPLPVAGLLASRGIAALAVSYWGTDRTPRGIANIDLEYFEPAIAWLHARPEAADVGIVGCSIGTALALLLGTRYRDLHAVVGLSGGWRVGASYGPGSGRDVAPWRWRGEPLPHMINDPALVEEAMKADPVRFDIVFSGEHPPESEIPIERINGPMLLASAGDDALGSLFDHLSPLIERARRARFPHGITRLEYPTAGHFGVGGPPGMATIIQAERPGFTMAFGGTAAANAAARADLWPKLLGFLRQHLG